MRTTPSPRPTMAGLRRLLTTLVAARGRRQRDSALTRARAWPLRMASPALDTTCEPTLVSVVASHAHECMWGCHEDDDGRTYLPRHRSRPARRRPVRSRRVRVDAVVFTRWRRVSRFGLPFIGGLR